MPHAEAAQAIIDQRNRERAERWNGDRPMFDSAYTKGDFLLATEGCEVWSKDTEGAVADIRLNPAGEPRGGVILDITTDVDSETGELRRAFRCIDYTTPLWLATTVLQEHQVDPDSFSAPNWARIRTLYRRLCREVSRQRGVASKGELDMVQTAARLAAILGRTLG